MLFNYTRINKNKNKKQNSTCINKHIYSFVSFITILFNNKI